MEAAAGTRRARQKKDVKSWEQTEGFIENKGLRGFQGQKQTGFSVQKPPNKAKNGAQNAEFRGWKKETGNTDLGQCQAAPKLDFSTPSQSRAQVPSSGWQVRMVRRLTDAPTLRAAAARPYAALGFGR
jgi:hypothetical protein